MQNSATILHARSRHHEWQGRGALSIKTFHGGQAHYQMAGAHHLVDDSCYLVLNAGQEYTTTVETPTPVESFCLFFAPGFAESVLLFQKSFVPGSSCENRAELLGTGVLRKKELRDVNQHNHWNFPDWADCYHRSRS